MRVYALSKNPWLVGTVAILGMGPVATKIVSASVISYPLRMLLIYMLLIYWVG